MRHEDRLYRYAERYFRRSGKTEFPTVRQCARALKIRQRDVEEIADGDGDARFMLTSYNAQLPGDSLGDHFVETFEREDEAAEQPAHRGYSDNPADHRFEEEQSVNLLPALGPVYMPRLDYCQHCGQHRDKHAA